MAQPRGQGPWVSSHGSFLLCSNEPGAEIELESVVWVEAPDVRAISVTPLLRVVDRSDLPTTPVGSTVGWPWDPMGVEPYPGDYSRKIRGKVITQTCDEFRARTTPHTEPVFTELFFVIETTRRGAHLMGTYIDYKVDGEKFRLLMGWQMFACGSVIRTRPDQQWCFMDHYSGQTEE